MPGDASRRDLRSFAGRFACAGLRLTRRDPASPRVTATLNATAASTSRDSASETRPARLGQRDSASETRPARLGERDSARASPGQMPVGIDGLARPAAAANPRPAAVSAGFYGAASG